MQSIAVQLLACALAVTFPSIALADLYGTSGNDSVLIGCTDHGFGTKAYACVNGSFVALGSAGSCAITSSIDVYLDTGHDFINVIGANNSYECAGETWDWTPVTLGFNVMNVWGQAGNDTIWADNQGIVSGHGGTGQDELYTTNSFAHYGDADEDRLESQSNSNSDDLYGGSEGDCLRDWNQQCSVMDGGTGTDVAYVKDCACCSLIEVSWSGACVSWYPGWH